MEALIRSDSNTHRLLDYEPCMRPIGAQLCGSNLDIAAQAARIIEDLGFDILDLNCGCPVDKVTKDGSGSGMLKQPERIGKMIRTLSEAVSIPVTVKIRAGWNDDLINGPEITKIAEQAGAKAIAIHGRTREQGYKGRANRDWIKACKAEAKKILVYGNGDVFDAASARSMFEDANCDAILLARGTLGKPWLIEDIIRDLSDLPPIERTYEDYRMLLLQHLDDIEAYHNPKKSLIEMRKIGCWYLKHMEGAKALRDALNRASLLSEARSIIESYEFQVSKELITQLAPNLAKEA